MAKIDLGKKWDDEIRPVSMSELKDETHYPEFHISDTEDSRLVGMPDEGEATIKYKVVHRTHSEHNRNGKKEHRCSITIEVRSIEPPTRNGKKKTHWEMFNK